MSVTPERNLHNSAAEDDQEFPHVVVVEEQVLQTPSPTPTTPLTTPPRVQCGPAEQSSAAGGSARRELLAIEYGQSVNLRGWPKLN